MSEEGINKLIAREGLKTKAYKDSGGVWTIGIGSIFYANGKRVKEGDTISIEEAKALFINSLQRYIALVKKWLKVKVSQGEFDDLVSLCYNSELAAKNHIERINNGKYS